MSFGLIGYSRRSGAQFEVAVVLGVPSEHLSACGAHDARFAVCSQVLLQVRLAAEPLVTHRAIKLLKASVCNDRNKDICTKNFKSVAILEIFLFFPKKNEDLKL